MTYEEWLARQPRIEPLIRCVEMTHPSWAEPIRIALDDANGTTITEASATGFYPFAPFQESQKNIGNSLDAGFDCAFGGYNKELLEILESTNFELQDYVSYRSMKLNATDTSYIMADYQLYVFGFEMLMERGAQFVNFEAVPPRGRYNQTGDTYNITEIPMLEAFL
ncbi:hypothetical protein [Vibrio phage BUCT006]|nr:hypothetical protein [Vibrio phage BUCT006]